MRADQLYALIVSVCVPL